MTCPGAAATIDLFGETASASTAVLDGAYRYQLSREWGAGPQMTFVMLNPSSADAEQDDPTIRRCIGFARREGQGSLRVVNLYAYRATRPSDLWLADDPVGPDNDRYLAEALTGGLVVAAWGANAKLERARRVLSLPGSGGLWCLGVTKNGAPRHPLYVRGDAPLLLLSEQLAWGVSV